MTPIKSITFGASTSTSSGKTKAGQQSASALSHQKSARAILESHPDTILISTVPSGYGKTIRKPSVKPTTLSDFMTTLKKIKR